jgi:hypothetical protein
VPADEEESVPAESAAEEESTGDAAGEEIESTDAREP